MFDSFWDNKLIKCASPRRGVKKSVKGFSEGCQLFLFSLIVVSCGSLEKRNDFDTGTIVNRTEGIGKNKRKIFLDPT